MKQYKTLFFYGLLLIIGCKSEPKETETKPPKIDTMAEVRKKLAALDPEKPYRELYAQHSDYLATKFDFPVGKPDAKGFYVAQKFGEHSHLGEDWNGEAGGNSDLGKPIYAIANGYVADAQDYGGGWGNVIRIVHGWKENDKLILVESLYAHCHQIKVKTGDWVKIGQEIGSIGTAKGKYKAHLHLEIRDKVGFALGEGYGENTFGFVTPTTFIKAHR